MEEVRSAEGLVKMMSNYLPGDREEVRKRCLRLLREELLEDVAKEVLKRKFKVMRSYKQVESIILGLELLSERWKDEALRESLDGNKKAKVKGGGVSEGKTEDEDSESRKA